MAGRLKFASHDEYIQSAPNEVQDILFRIQAVVESMVPKATRCISYNLPAFKLGRTFFYFAAFKKHIGVYPPITIDNGLIDELKPYRNEKGNLAFPLNQPIPYELIGRVALALSIQYGRPTT